MDAYVGLEMAMSLIPITDIKEFWSTKMFQGHHDFKATMSRARFQEIRGSLQVHAPYDSAGCTDFPQLPAVQTATIGTVDHPGNVITQPTPAECVEIGSGREQVEAASAASPRIHQAEEVARLDPLRHSRLLLQHFQATFATMAVPFGVSTIDEVGVRTKARTSAKSYMKSKPDKFAVRFYAVVGWSSLYIHSLWDNGSGNMLPTTAAQRYTELFPTMRRPLKNTLDRADVTIKLDEAGALWMAMIGHQTKIFPAPTGKRLIISDNFYTRHELARATTLLTDSEFRMVGTARKDWVGPLNKEAVYESIQRVSKLPRGYWELVAARHYASDARSKDAFENKQKKLPEHRRKPYQANKPVFSDRAGFIVWNDKKPCVFYTNDLARSPSARVLGGNNREAIYCCHGLYPIRRWTGDEVMHRKIFMVPAIIAAYNIGMNGVDRVDQLRSTNPTRRKEMRLSMSIFTWLLDLSIINAFALLQSIDGKPNAPRTVREFKRRVCETLTSAQRLATRQKRESSSQKRCRPDALPDSCPKGVHVLTENSRESSSGKLVCHLCSLQDIKDSKSRYGCTECQVGYHVNCFAVAHNERDFSNPTPSVAKALKALQNARDGNAPSKTRRRSNNTTTSLEKLSLPN